jgi:hypothetical protein
MLAICSLLLMAVSTMGMGYGFKKSWLLWLSIPFWFVLFLYIAYNEAWFPSIAQHSFVLLGIGTTIGLGFTAIRMQAKPANEHHDDDNLDDDDASTKIYKAERKKYRRSS